jgi:hypothetical protein
MSHAALECVRQIAIGALQNRITVHFSWLRQADMLVGIKRMLPAQALCADAGQFSFASFKIEFCAQLDFPLLIGQPLNFGRSCHAEMRHRHQKSLDLATSRAHVKTSTASEVQHT